jgi:hypothetical protein
MRACPPEIVEILLEMLGSGLVVVRARGWNGQAAECAVEADDLHNLPALLADYDPHRLLYYWDVERVCYLRKAPTDRLPTWEMFWSRLEPHVESARSHPAHS